MKSTLTSALLRAAAVSFSAAASIVAAHAQYTGVLLSSDGWALDAYNGFQVGRAPTFGGSHPYIWKGTAASGVDLMPAGTFYSSGGANTIWGSRMSIRLTETVSRIPHGFLRDLNTSALTELAVGLSREDLAITGMDGVQQVGRLGYLSNDPFSHGLLWSGTAASVIDLTPDGATSSMAFRCRGGIQVGVATYGSDGLFSGPDFATLWMGTPESVVNLNPTGSSESAAYALDGLEVGGEAFGTVFTGLGRAAIWFGTPDSCVDITPAGFGSGEVFSIALGNEVGVATDGDGINHAFRWSHTADSALDLNAFLPPDLPSDFVNIEADGIDPITGDIVGTAYNSDFSQACAILWKANTPAGPAQLIQSDINQVQVLLTLGALSQTDADGLLAKLNAALNANNPHAAIGQLGAFINQVNSLISGGTLTQAQGQILIDYANAVLVMEQSQLP